MQARRDQSICFYLQHRWCGVCRATTHCDGKRLYFRGCRSSVLYLRRTTLRTLLTALFYCCAVVFPDRVCQDTIKARMQVSKQYSGIIDCAVKTVKGEGSLALFKGFTPAYASAVRQIKQFPIERQTDSP